MGDADGTVRATRAADVAVAHEDHAAEVFREHGASFLEREGIDDLAAFREQFGIFGESLQNQLLEGLHVPFASRLQLLRVLKGGQANVDGGDIDGDTQHQIQEIQAAEEQLEQWRKLSGMNRIVRQLEEHKNDPLGTVNGLTLALVNGVEGACATTVDGIQESAVIAALILSFSVPITIDPPDAILDLEDDDWRRVFHFLGWGLVTAVGACVILYAKIFTTAVGRSVRRSDKLEILLSSDAFTNILVLTYSLFGFFMFAWLADVVLIYGDAEGSALFLAAGLMIGFSTFKGMSAISAGHIQYGWRRRAAAGEDIVDDRLAFGLLQKKAKAAKALEDSAWSVFRYVSGGTACVGISERGQRLLFKDGGGSVKIPKGALAERA